MSVTFNNEIFTGADATVGAIVGATLVLPATFVGTTLTGQIGVTTVTIDGTIGAPGSTANVSINATGIALNDPTSTYAGFTNTGGDYVYYFNVAGTNGLTGQALTVSVAVSAEGVAGLLGVNATPIDTSATTAPLDPNLPNGAVAPGPVLTSAIADGATVTLAYSEALSPVTALPGAFTVTAGGVAATVTAAVVDPTNPGHVVLTLATPVASGQAVTVAYTDPTTANDLLAVQDALGNDAATSAPIVAANATPAVPVLGTAPVFQAAAVNGAALTLTYDEALSPVTAATGAFTVQVDGQTVGVTAVATANDAVTLALGTAVTAGQTVTVAYADPTTGNDVAAVQSLLGTDAASLATTAVANGTPTVPVLDPGTGTGTGTGAGTGSTTGMSGDTTVTTDPTTGGTTATTTSPLGTTTTLSLPPGSTVAQGPGGDLISIDPYASFEGRGQFTISGHVTSGSSVQSVTISAVIDEGESTVLGSATVAADGSYTFLDKVGSHLQGFITATETDGLGNTLSVQSPYSLQAGLRGVGHAGEQDLYTPSGDAEVALTSYRRDGSRSVDILDSGQTFQSDFFDTFMNHGAPNNTFVFNQNHGLDVIGQFRVDGADHDTISLPSADFADLAAVMSATHTTAGGAVIVDPTTGDAIKIAGVSKAELRANPSDFTFHA